MSPLSLLKMFAEDKMTVEEHKENIIEPTESGDEKAVGGWKIIEMDNSTGLSRRGRFTSVLSSHATRQTDG